MKKNWIKPHEFWNPRLFELPFYIYLAFQCLIHQVSVRGLAKANYALDHGEIGIGSKFHTQKQFDQRRFLATELIAENASKEEKVSQIKKFASQHGYPVILKPDTGMVGKGILKLEKASEIDLRVLEIEGSYIVQQFTPLPLEYGVFYIRLNGEPRITGINRKHFPTVTGNGRDCILTLAKNHYRYSHHWSTFLQYIDTSRVPHHGERVKLSFIGSHTMGCMFTDDTALLTPELQREVFAFFSSQQGYNFGRMDVKVASEEDFQRGEFTVIEVNGVSSLPTHMFDPGLSLFQSYRIFFEHGRYLAKIAKEYQQVAMELLPMLEIARRVKKSQSALNRLHNQLKGDIAQ